MNGLISIVTRAVLFAAVLFAACLVVLIVLLNILRGLFDDEAVDATSQGNDPEPTASSTHQVDN